ncbi:MAG: hypothetical protein KJZ69_04330 [Phycisphaerales bacterium]|nr:hypothetical protein [Phycisphaerales bacterium]
MLNQRQGDLSLLGVLMLAVTSTPVLGFPDSAQFTNGDCFACHTSTQTGRMELMNFTGLVDPVERQGVPDQGELKYFTVQAGQAVGMTIHALNGHSKYAFQILGFDDPEVTRGGTLVYSDDPLWLAYRGSFKTYFCRADGGSNGYDWGTNDPTEVTYNIQVDAATPPGYYLMRSALAGQSGDWYQEELFYLEVTAGNPPVTLTVDATCPGGGPIVISWSNATPNSTVALLYARNTGNFPIPQGNPCAGTPLGLGTNQLQVAWQGGSGANGSRTLNANTGSGVCGGYFQLLDIASCRTSNVVRAQ